jgi:hypothetical protein
MKMAIRLNEFAEGLDQEITILDLKPRMNVGSFEHSALQPQSVSRNESQNESQYENFLNEIDVRVWQTRTANGFGNF